jgi:DNA modification methylase
MLRRVVIKEITTLARERIRRDYGDIEELAASMARYGQIQPIVIDDKNVLVAGGRRLAAAIHLGWTEIECVSRDDVSETERKEIELEENLRRKDLTWVEEVKAVRALYELRVALHGARDTSSRDTHILGEADEGYSTSLASRDLDRSKSSVVTDINLAKALERFPELEKEGSKAAAWKRYKLLRETELRTEQARRTREPENDPFVTDPNEIEDDELTDAEKAALGPEGEIEPRAVMPTKVSWKGHGMLYLADSAELCKLLPPRSVDCIVTDPPFALGLFKQGQATTGSRLAESAGHMYDDDPIKVMDMLDRVFMYASKLLKPNGHAYIFFHMTKYEELFLILRHHFGSVEETPILWIKNTPGIGDPNKTWVYAYEPVFWVNKGRHLVKPQAFNYLRYDTIPPGQKIHPTEKPAALLRHIIGASCLPGEVVFDPFVGSGSTLVAAAQVGCRFIGIEKEERFHRAAVERVSEALAEAPPPPRYDQSATEAAGELNHGDTHSEGNGS